MDLQKTSFPPISDLDSQILILGSMPGERSLEQQEYYAHPRNNFWKIIAEITNNEQPHTYSDKKSLLLKSKIAVWDIAHKAERIGSLDVNIKNETPNKIEEFIEAHKKLRVIAFNGQKAEKLFDKYFDRKPNIKYISLPSTSPANAQFNYERLHNLWKELVHFIN